MDPKSLPVDEYSASLGLAFTPLVPSFTRNSVGKGGGGVGESKEAGEGARAELREKKNVNRQFLVTARICAELISIVDSSSYVFIEIM